MSKVYKLGLYVNVDTFRDLIKVGSTVILAGRGALFWSAAVTGRGQGVNTKLLLICKLVSENETGVHS